MQRRILIAEDNLEISDTMRNYLIRAGYVVSQAFDGGDAIEQARRLSPDLESILNYGFQKNNQLPG